jgi:hypothetical protein
MTDLRKAAEKALEALDWVTQDSEAFSPLSDGWDLVHEKIKLLRQTLSQPEPKPVGQILYANNELYTVTIFESATQSNFPVVPIYIAPPKREWVGLTDEEIRDLWSWSVSRAGEDSGAPTGQHAFARAIEAKLKEKNS